jgi:thioredoxin reductase
MAVDTPATIAIVGAGPIGLEAALYARFLGYAVRIFEQDKVASHVLRCGHARMFSPFRSNCSTLGLAALHAQDATYRAPQPEVLLTAREWVDRYLLPVASTDLLEENIQTGCRVASIGRPDSVKTLDPANDDRAEQPFRILYTDKDGEEQIETAEVVIDTSGVLGQPNWCGRGGIPARGERQLRSKIEFCLPDVLGAERALYADRHTLIIGEGMSAATTVTALVRLAQDAPATRITWVTRATHDKVGPMAVDIANFFPAQRQLAEEANTLTCGSHPSVTWIGGSSMEAIHYDETEHSFHVTLDSEEEVLLFDRVVADVGFQPDLSIFRELRVETCPVNETFRVQESNGAKRLILTEPDFYVLGAKSAGRTSPFLYATGLEQIRQLFTIIGDRVDLDLYATAKNLPR